MVNNLMVALSRIFGQIIILLIMTGLGYLTYTGVTSSATPWLESAASLAATTVTLTATPSKEATSANVTPRSTPANQATVDYLKALATADAAFNETSTPDPSTGETATLLPPTTTATLTPQSPSAGLIIVTETPTPLNIITVAAQAARATAIATTVGTYTPIPFNWILPIVVTPEPATPIPANAATATFQIAEATAAAFVNGTPTPTPFNVWTATPTPFMLPVIGEVATPWVPPPPTPPPPPIPQGLVGKILFLSNRSGGPLPLDEPFVYAIDPDGSNLAVLNDDLLYQIALTRDTYSADQRYLTFAKLVPRTINKVSELGLAIIVYDFDNKLEEQITYFGLGESWDPVWSPTREQIAFVADERNGHAEIWITNRDGSGQQQLTQTSEAAFASTVGKNNFLPDEENGRPSWSPDGSQIVFWANNNQHRQIWVMNADGSNAYSLSTTSHDDWDPVWVKYTDPPRPPVLGIGPPPPPPPPISNTGGQ